MRKILKRRSGELYRVCVLVVCAMLVLALVVRCAAGLHRKQQLDTYAVELVRQAESPAGSARRPPAVRWLLPTAPGLTPTSVVHHRTHQLNDEVIPVT